MEETNTTASTNLVRNVVDSIKESGGLLEGLRGLREKGEIDQVSLGMDARLEEAAAGIISLLDEAPADTFDTALIAYGWTLGNQNALPVLDEYMAATGLFSGKLM